MKDNDQFLERAELCHRTRKIEAVERASQEQVGGGKLLAEAWTIAFLRFVFFNGDFERGFPSQTHEHNVNRNAVQPGRESGFTAEGADLAQDQQKCFLGEIFGFSGVSYHAQAKSVDMRTVQPINTFECGGISALGTVDGFLLRQFSRAGRLAFREIR